MYSNSKHKRRLGLINQNTPLVTSRKRQNEVKHYKSRKTIRNLSTTHTKRNGRATDRQRAPFLVPFNAHLKGDTWRKYISLIWKIVNVIFWLECSTTTTTVKPPYLLTPEQSLLSLPFYHSKCGTREEMEKMIGDFAKTGTDIVATNLLGLGLDIPYVSLVIHIGAPR
jgi:Lhr-like helicase